MKYILNGSDNLGSAQEILITLFPDDKPVLVNEIIRENENGVFISVKRTEKTVLANTLIKLNGKSAAAISRLGFSPETPFELKKAEGKAIKKSVYKAYVTLFRHGKEWGSLTGVRPSKIARAELEKGFSADKTDSLIYRKYNVKSTKRRIMVETAISSIEKDKLRSANDVSLYFSIPFCPTRCAYCSFVSQSTEKERRYIDPYLKSMAMEIDAVSEIIKETNLSVNCIYIGGGTPTVLTSSELYGLVSHINKRFDMSNVREFTVEAGRPDTIDEDKLDVLFSAGVDRISINPQSMDQAILQSIGRKHTPEDTVNAYTMVRRKNEKIIINMDIIAGLPGDNMKIFNNTLKKVIDLSPENITVHSFAFKRGSHFNSQRSKLIISESVGPVINRSSAILRKAGYRPYYTYRQKFTAGAAENTGWSKPGFESFYNIYNMEELQTVLAVGAGAVTKLVDRKTNFIERIFNPKYPHEYIERINNIISGKEQIKNFHCRERKGQNELCRS